MDGSSSHSLADGEQGKLGCCAFLELAICFLCLSWGLYSSPSSHSPCPRNLDRRREDSILTSAKASPCPSAAPGRDGIHIPADGLRTTGQGRRPRSLLLGYPSPQPDSFPELPGSSCLGALPMLPCFHHSLSEAFLQWGFFSLMPLGPGKQGTFLPSSSILLPICASVCTPWEGGGEPECSSLYLAANHCLSRGPGSLGLCSF